MGGLATVGDVNAYIDRVAANLDPDSRYIPELRALIAPATTTAEVEAILDAESRGLTWSGAEAFSRMTLAEKLYANLITPETKWFRFEEPEIALVRETRGAILIVPCSTGEEAYSVATWAKEATLTAVDYQPELIAYARRRTDVERVGDRLTFLVGDAFDLDFAPQSFDLVLSRNFLGYFRPDRAAACAVGLARLVRDDGVLLLDDFCLEKMPPIEASLASAGWRRRADLAAFERRA